MYMFVRIHCMCINTVTCKFSMRDSVTGDHYNKDTRKPCTVFLYTEV